MKNIFTRSKSLFASLVVAVMLTFSTCQKADKIENSRSSDGREPSSPTTGLPDLTIDAARLQSTAVVKTKVFKSTDCAMVEGCVTDGGKRKLLKFDVATPNIGTADLVLGDPSGNPLFEFSPCHKHYHFSAYATYELLDKTATIVVVTGRKQAFCLEDYARYSATALSPKFTCSYQGISVGWQDVYGSYLDCQWLDVTNVPAGEYRLRVTINPDFLLTELTYANNTATVPVTIPK